jgi:septal ring factor EnvC (AmiA/AmiB activator)
MLRRLCSRRISRASASRIRHALAIAHNEKDELQKQLKAVERDIESLLDRVVDATSASVVSAYEARIQKLERQKIVLTERVESPPVSRKLSATLLFLYFTGGRDRTMTWDIHRNARRLC